MAPRACFLILSFAAALHGTQATDDSVCMLQNSATASGELTEAAAAQVSEEKPWNPFWWMSTKAKGKELMAKPQWPFKDMKAKPAAEKAKQMKAPVEPEHEEEDKDNEEAEADRIVVVQDTPAVTATAPPRAAKAVAPQATPTAPAPEMPFESALPFKVPSEIATEPTAPALSEDEPEASVVPRSVAGAPMKSHRWHLERKYAADYPGGPTLAVRQRLQKARLANEKERKEELKKKWHQRQAKERRMAELRQKEKESALLHEKNTRELELQRQEAALERRQARKDVAAKVAREQEKAEKKRDNEKRKREYAARMEQQHWENEAKQRRAARAAKAKLLKNTHAPEHEMLTKGHQTEKEVPSKHAQVQLSMEQEKQHESQREEALTRKYGHEVKPALQHGTVNLKVWSPFQAHSIDAKVPLTARMDVLMKVAATRLGVAPETAHLKWGHRVLSGQVTVGTYGLKDGDELHLEQVQGH